MHANSMSEKKNGRINGKGILRIEVGLTHIHQPILKYINMPKPGSSRYNGIPSYCIIPQDCVFSFHLIYYSCF